MYDKLIEINVTGDPIFFSLNPWLRVSRLLLFSFL